MGTGVFNTITSKIVSIAKHRARYDDVLRRVFMEFFTEARMLPWIDSLYDRIGADTVEEITKFRSYTRQMTEATYWGQREVLKRWVSQRRNFVLSQVMIPVAGLTCREGDGNVVEMRWDIAAGHARDRILVDGEPVGNIAGTVGAFTAGPLPRGTHEVCVVGYNGGRLSPEACCQVTLAHLAPPGTVAAAFEVTTGGELRVRASWVATEAYDTSEIFLDRGDGFTLAEAVPGSTLEAAIPAGDLTDVTVLRVGVQGSIGEERSALAVAELPIAIAPVDVVYCSLVGDPPSVRIFYQPGTVPGDGYQAVEVLANGVVMAQFDPAEHPQFFELNPDPGLSGIVRITLRGVWYGARASEGASCDVDLGGGPAFIRGDATADGTINISDAMAILGYLFGSGSLSCERAADADASGRLNVSDAIRTLRYLFADGPPPAPPFPACGPPATSDNLTCESFPPCNR
jgi:hypothetical protein